MASGDIGQDDLIETLENLFKTLANKRALAKKRTNDKERQNVNFLSKNREDHSSVEKIGSSKKELEEKEENILLPEDRLTKEEALKYLNYYKSNFDLSVYNMKETVLNEEFVTLYYVEKGEDVSPSKKTLTFNLETGKGKFTDHSYTEVKGAFQNVSTVEKRFSQEELVNYYNGIEKNKDDISVEKSAGAKVNLIDSMTSYAKTLKLNGYHISSQSVTEKKAMIFMKHESKLGNVMQLSYNIEKESGKLTHLISNKENNYANEKTIKNEFTKADLENHGYGKTIEQIELERQKQREQRENIEDVSSENHVEYDEKVLESQLGKSVTKQVLNNPELLKGAVALYQLTSMRKLLSNAKDQIENLNKLLNKKDVNIEEITNVKDNLSKQMDILQGKVSALENNQETSKTFDKLNEAYKKDRDEEYEKNIENQPTRKVEFEHSM